MEIYFICTGNTCRSPMAEAILRGHEIDGVTVRSAGIYAVEGSKISEHAETLVKKFQLPYSETSKMVDIKHMQSADYVLTMTEAHKQLLINMFPAYEQKIETLKSFVQDETGQNVLDPYGSNLAGYERTFEELTQLIDRLAMRLNGG
ncbi:MAG TPA: low molecular weight protein arginine phosphatase [Sporosarcina sp.]|nr:low molecular weight protein arginine phosphatase [Sporosarcina sp.]